MQKVDDKSTDTEPKECIDLSSDSDSENDDVTTDDTQQTIEVSTEGSDVFSNSDDDQNTTDLDRNTSNTMLDMSTGSLNDVLAAENNQECVEVSNEVPGGSSNSDGTIQVSNGQSNADKQNVRISV